MSANRPPAKPGKQPAKGAPPAPSRSKVPLIVGAVLVLVLVVALVVVLASGGDDDTETASTVPPVATGEVGGDTTPGSAPTGSTPSGGTLDPALPDEYAGEVRPVVVEGEALPQHGEGDDPAVGMVPPTLLGEQFDGSPITVGPGDTNPTLVVFLAHWCPHCNDEIPRLIQLQEEGRLPADLEVVAVSTGVAPDRPNFPPSEWLPEKGWPWPVLVDNIDIDAQQLVAAQAYGLSGFPFITVIGEDGTVAARWSGQSDVDTLEQQINDALGR